MQRNLIQALVSHGTANTLSAEAAYLSTSSGQRFIANKAEAMLGAIRFLHIKNRETIAIEAIEGPLKAALTTALSKLGNDGKNLNTFLAKQSIDKRYHEEINTICARFYNELHGSDEFKFFNNLHETVKTEKKFCEDANALADAYLVNKNKFAKMVNEKLRKRKMPQFDLVALFEKIIAVTKTEQQTPSSPEEIRMQEGKKNREMILEEQSYSLKEEEIEQKNNLPYLLSAQPKKGGLWRLPQAGTKKEIQDAANRKGAIEGSKHK